MPKPPHRPPHEPTAKTRAQVQIMVGGGMTQDGIAQVIGVSLPTLHKHYRKELDEGKAQVQGRVLTQLVPKALKGDNACMFFLLRTQYGYREKLAVSGDKDGDPIKVEAKATVEATQELLTRLDRIKSKGG